jgi:hypothetical protein
MKRSLYQKSHEFPKRSVQMCECWSGCDHKKKSYEKKINNSIISLIPENNIIWEGQLFSNNELLIDIIIKNLHPHFSH